MFVWKSYRLLYQLRGLEGAPLSPPYPGTMKAGAFEAAGSVATPEIWRTSAAIFGDVNARFCLTICSNWLKPNLASNTRLEPNVCVSCELRFPLRLVSEPKKFGLLVGDSFAIALCVYRPKNCVALPN